MLEFLSVWCVSSVVIILAGGEMPGAGAGGGQQRAGETARPQEGGHGQDTRTRGTGIKISMMKKSNYD